MLLQRAIIFQSRRTHKDYVFKSDFPLSEYFFDFSIGKEDFLINGVHLQSPQPKGLIFFLHGTFNHIQYHIPRVEEYLKNNYDVFIMDYPKYGKSKGKLTEELLYEVVEITYQKAIDQLNKQSAPAYLQNIIIAGRSLGTAIASNLATKIHPKKLILISPYYNMPDLFHHHAKLFPFKNLKFRFENDSYLPNVKCDTYILHGDDDKLIPAHLSKKLIPHLKDASYFIEIPGANHFNVHEKEAYKSFLKKILHD